MGAVAVGATIYFGSDESARQIVEVAQAFQAAHEMGMATVLWCYLRNPAFKTKEKDFHVSADLTGQANHLGVTIEADIIKQKLPENNGGYNAISSKENPYGKTDKRIYSELTTDHPIDLCRYQVANCYMGRAGLINSGGASGENDFAEAVKTAVINKRAGGMGLISGRKAFQRPMAEGVKLLNADPGRLPLQGRHDRVVTLACPPVVRGQARDLESPVEGRARGAPSPGPSIGDSAGAGCASGPVLPEPLGSRARLATPGPAASLRPCATGPSCAR